MKIAITGNTSGLGKVLASKLKKNHQIMGFSRKNIPIENYNEIVKASLNCDVFINNAHTFFYQTLLLQAIFNKWKNKNKIIVNIISRSKYPNISEGFLYSSSKASLSHLSHSLRFKTEKKCKIIDICPGLINSKIDSLTYNETADIIIWCINQPKHIEIGEISFWHKTSNLKIQRIKKKLINKL
tara:strand:+ start:282 stop:833 length:552 start_codon:yes stop_codon:yes gene_type:complete